MRRYFFLLIIFSSFFPALCYCQAGFPDANETPFSNKAKGFVQVSLGFSYIPLVSFTGEHTSSDTTIDRIFNARTKPPGLSATMGIVPVFNDNGVLFEVSYALNGAEYLSDVSTYDGTVRGETTLGFSQIDVALGYTRYFMDGPWHVFVTGKSGIEIAKIEITSDYDGESKTSTSQINNGMAGLSFGFFHEVTSGGIGGELRVDTPFLKSKFDISDPYGKMDLTMEHPINIKLVAIFLLGRL